MSAEALFNELKKRQVELWCQGKMLRFRAPDGALDDPIMAELRRYKKELIALIRNEGVDQSDANECASRLEPTTISQQAMYFLHLSAPYSPAYNVASAFRVRSNVDIEAVQQAIAELMKRHDVLRSSMEMNGGNLQRRVSNNMLPDFAVVEANDANDASLNEMVRKEYQRPFDLASGPLIRTRLFKVNDQDYVFLIVLHHIIFDAWSLWIVQEEFHKLCVQFGGGEPAELTTPSATYTDFVKEQSELIESARGQELLDYWRNELSGDLPILNLPLDYPRPQRPGLRGSSHRFRIPSELSSRLRDLAKRLRVTPFVLTMSIFKVLLRRVSGQNDLIVGTTTSGRPNSDYTHTAGYFVNTLAIRSKTDCDPTFAEYAGQVKQQVLGAIRNQDYPFAALVDRLGAKRESGRAPVCSVMFGLQKPRFGDAARLFNENSQAVEIGGWQVSPFDLDQQEGQFDLTLELFETEDSFLGLLKYDTELFSKATADRLSRQYVRLAEAIADSPDRSLLDYELLSEVDTKQLLAFSSGGPLEGSVHQTVIGDFSEKALTHSDKLAICCDNVQLTYADLDRRSNQLARLLIDSGLKTSDIVACCCSRRIEIPIMILGIMKAGGTYLPLDPANPPQRLAQLINDSGCRLVIADSCLPNETRQSLMQPILDVDHISTEMDARSAEHLSIGITPETNAYVLYTSGSTGVPKGVCVSHTALYRHVLSIRQAFGLREDDRVLQFSNLTFDPSLEQMFAPWSLGASVHMRGNELWSPETLCDTVCDLDLTVINLPPAYFKHCAASIGNTSNDGRRHDTSLRLIILGGDVFPADSVRELTNRGVQILNAYGPTEAVITSTTFDASGLSSTVKSAPIGRPKPGSRAYVLDSKNRMMPVGVPGRLFLAGPMLASGYLNDHKFTREKFVADCLAEQFGESGRALMYDTGDIARWNPDGELEFLGRADRQLKIHGMRVETGEIEATINSCEGVKNSHVSVRNSAGQDELIAWVAVGKDDSVSAKVTDESVLLRKLQAGLPKFMVPRQIVFLPELPLNTSGKIDITQLPEPDAGARRSNIAQYVAPQSAWEITLSNIWSEELNVSPVGINDNFFDLGGASLSSLRIVSRMNQEGLNPSEEPLKPEMLFEFQTIRELADKLAVLEESVAADC